MSGKSRKSGRKLRRILLLVDFNYTSAKPVAAGVIRFASAHPGIEVDVRGGHPGNADDFYAAAGGMSGILSCLGSNREALRRAVSANPGKPVVFASVMRHLAKMSGVHSAAVVCDNAALSAAAAALLLRHGISEFGYVGALPPSDDTDWDAERREAFLSALSAAGATARVYAPGNAATHDHPRADDDSASLAAWLKALPKPCGVFASYDQRAMRVLDACRAAGIRVPEQVQVVGADNEEWICEHVSPTLTSVEPDFEGCGYRAAEILVAMMDGLPAPETETFGVRRVEQRMSTTDIHGDVNRALCARRTMRERLGDVQDMQTLASQLGCSVRTLQLSYKSVFGKTPREDLAEMRLEKARRLLSDTSVPICEIPARLGYEDPCSLMRLFRRSEGMTMLQYRRRHRAR